MVSEEECNVCLACACAATTPLGTEFGGEREEFENEKNARPATTHIREGKLRWKDDKRKKKADQDVEAEDSGSAPDSNTITLAINILKLWNEQHLLEEALNQRDTKAVSDFFNAASAYENNSNMVARLIDKAVRRTIRRTLKGTTNLGFTVTEEQRMFLERKLRAKRILLDVLMKNAKLLPESWASRSLYVSIDNADKREQQRQKERKDKIGKENEERKNVQNEEEKPEQRMARSVEHNAGKVMKRKSTGKTPETMEPPPLQTKESNAENKKARNYLREHGFQVVVL
ncbi:hypothetical protein Aduo_003121 [Ancylostoma duodenale]